MQNHFILSFKTKSLFYAVENASFFQQIDTVRVITPALIIPHMQKAVAVSESICRGRLQKLPKFANNASFIITSSCS